MKNKYKEAFKSLIYLAIVAAAGAALEYRLLSPKINELETKNDSLERELDSTTKPLRP